MQTEVIDEAAQPLESDLVALPEPPNHWAEMLGGLEWPRGSGNKAARVWAHRIGKLVVMRSLSKTKNNGRWYHVSVSRDDRLPSWEEISKVKNEFLGEDHEAYQVLAANSDHVNVHPRCLHIWAKADVGERKMVNLQDITWETSI